MITFWLATGVLGAGASAPPVQVAPGGRYRRYVPIKAPIQHHEDEELETLRVAAGRAAEVAEAKSREEKRRHAEAASAGIDRLSSSIALLQAGMARMEAIREAQRLNMIYEEAMIAAGIELRRLDDEDAMAVILMAA